MGSGKGGDMMGMGWGCDKLLVGWELLLGEIDAETVSSWWVIFG